MTAVSRVRTARERLAPTVLVAAGLLAVAAAVATFGVHTVTRSWGFVPAAAIGAGLAMALSLVAHWRRLFLGETVAVAVVVLVAGGSAVALGPGSFFDGITDGWSQLLSATIPADVTVELRVVALVVAFVGALVAGETLLRVGQPALPIVGPLGGLALTTLLSDEERDLNVVIGAVLVAVALSVALLQQRGRRTAEVDAERRTWTPRRSVTAIAVVAAIAVAAPVVAPRLPLVDAEERYDLRDQVVPPWDPLALPSPLTQLKPVLRPPTDDGDGADFPVVFTARSEQRPTRFALATMGAYDGIVWSVGSGIDDAQREFVPVGSRLPEPPDDHDDATTVEATITIDQLDEPWLPSPGWPRQLDVEPAASDADADADEVIVRENVNTGTLAVPGGLGPGASYDIRAIVPASLTDDELAARTMTPLPPSVDLTALPPPVQNLAADIIEGRDPGWAQVAALRDRFVDFGFYGVDETARPGHSYFRIAEFLNDPDVIYGYEEQYAAAAALIGRIADLPTRVVVGYEIAEDRYVDDLAEVRADDLTAWVEARVDGVGWIAVDVTPETALEPEEQQQQTVPNEVPAPNPPPPPPPPPDLDVVPENETEPEEEPEEEEDDEAEPMFVTIEGRSLGPVAAAGGGLGGALVLFALVVVGWKWRRQHRRRTAAVPAHRIAGAWRELADRYQEAGIPIPTQATPLEAARAYLTTETSAPAVRPDLIGLVRTVDRSAWHTAQPEAREADDAWQYCDRVVEALARDRTWPRRVRMRLDPRPLWRRDAWLRAARRDATAGGAS